MYSLGIMYHEALGVDFSYDLAWDLFQKAADAGHENAAEMLETMKLNVYGPNGVIQ